MASKKYGYMATIGADTSGLTSALQNVDSEAKKISSELKEINNNLKFDDGGAVALQQKYDLLQQAIEQTRQKLELLQKAESDVNAAATAGTISEANQRAYQRELDSTANKLARYQKEAEKTSEALQNLANGQETANAAMQTSEEIADIVHNAMERYSDSAKSAAASNEEESKSLDKVEESAEKASEALKKVALSNNMGYDQSAIDYIENFGKKSEEALSAYDKYKASVGETNEVIKQSEAEYNKLNKMLAENADNQVLSAQKNEIKNQIIEAETYKLEKLKQQYNAMKQAFDSGDIGAEQFREFQREIEQTKIKLAELEKSEEDAADAAKDYEKAIDGAGQQTITFGDIVKANFLGDVISNAFRKAVSAAGDFIKQGVELASSLTEVKNVVDTTFGSGAQEIYKWADAAAESYGMSSLAAQQYSGTLGAMLKSMGLADDAVKKMSMDMVGLAGDMASFYNIDVEKAFEKIRSGISGETEPLKQLGINMSVANLEAYALSQGIKTAYKEMTEAEKATLRYNYLMAQTADAQGDFARTSDSFANQQRILELQTQNLAAAFGEKLLPSLNNVLNTANEKLPQTERTVENIGKTIGKVTEFALENHEAILGLITAYGTFYGVMKAGTAINTAVTAVKSLTTATKAAETAQHGMNAAAAANPYVLLASAIAALVVGLATYANSLDTVHNRIKDVNKEVKELKKNTEESIESTESEIAVFKDKARQYEELREKANRTAGEEERLKKLAEELQQYMPDGTKLINEQTGAYNSLADSIDSVSEAMRRKATIAAYEEEYTGLIKQQLEAQKNLDAAQERMKKFVEEGGKISADSLNPLNAIQNAVFLSIQNDIDGALESLDKVNAEIEATDKKLNALYEQEPKQQISTGETYGEYMKRRGEEQAAEIKRRRAEDLKNYEENLKAKKEEWDNNLALRRMSEEKYWQEVGKYLSENKNLESKAYFELLGKYEDYLEKKQKTADKAAEDAQKAAKKAAEDEQKAVENAEKERVNAIKASWDKITAMKDRGEIDEVAEYKLKAQIVKKYCDENEATWDSYYKWLYDYTKKQENEIAKERLKAWEDNSKKLADTLSESYKELKAQKEQVKKELQSIDLTETVTDKDGKEITVLKDLDAEIKKIDKLAASRKKLQETGISDSLLAKIDKMNYADGSRQRYIDQLLSLSPEKLQLYYDDWNKLQAKQEEFAQGAIQDKLDETNQAAAEGVSDIFGDLPAEAYEDGIKTAQQYLQGIIDGMEGVNDVNAITGILSSSYSYAGNSPQTPKVGGHAAESSAIPASTPININLNDKAYISTTLSELISKGRITGGNTFNL